LIAIECTQLTKDYPVGFWRQRPRRALDQLSLQVEAGEIFGFLGHNGAGKTTTLKLLLRLVYPTAGTARILGKPIGDPRLARQIGYLPEAPYFYDYLTCRELLAYYAELAGVAPATREADVRVALRRLGMESFADLSLRKCSKGMLQRVGLAQAIVHRPAVVFLDEPMSGLDPIGRREVRDLMLELKAQGTTIFFSTHILSDAEQICDRVAILQQGCLRGMGRLEELLAEPRPEVEVVWMPASNRPLPEAWASAAQLLSQNGQRRSVVASCELWNWLDALRAHGGRLISLTPLRRSLEEVYFQDAPPKDASGGAA